MAGRTTRPSLRTRLETNLMPSFRNESLGTSQAALTGLSRPAGSVVEPHRADGGVMRVKTVEQHPQPSVPYATSIPPTDAARAAAADRWERRGLLRRLVRRD